MIRRSAVPLVLEGIRKDRPGRPNLMRIVRETDDYSTEAEMMRKVAENRMRLSALTRQIEDDFAEDYDPDDFTSELDYIKTTIQLGILQVTGELEATKTADEIFETEAAAVVRSALARL